MNRDTVIQSTAIGGIGDYHIFDIWPTREGPHLQAAVRAEASPYIQPVINYLILHEKTDLKCGLIGRHV